MKLYTFLINDEIYLALFYDTNEVLRFYYDNIDDGSSIDVLDVKGITREEAHNIKGLEYYYVEELFNLFEKVAYKYLTN